MQRVIDGLVIAAALLTVEAWEKQLAAGGDKHPIHYVSFESWDAAQALLMAYDLWATDRPWDHRVAPSLLLHQIH